MGSPAPTTRTCSSSDSGVFCPFTPSRPASCVSFSCSSCVETVQAFHSSGPVLERRTTPRPEPNLVVKAKPAWIKVAGPNCSSLGPSMGVCTAVTSPSPVVDPRTSALMAGGPYLEATFQVRATRSRHHDSCTNRLSKPATHLSSMAEERAAIHLSTTSPALMLSRAVDASRQRGGSAVRGGYSANPSAVAGIEGDIVY